jgi:large subunit ribosomal protein L30
MSAAKAKKDSDVKTILIRQVGSGIGCPVEMRETLKALGLGKMHRVAERKDTKEIRGMIAKIPHLVEVVE